MLYRKAKTEWKLREEAEKQKLLELRRLREEELLARRRRYFETRGGRICNPVAVMDAASLRNEYVGKDIWVVCAAPSIDYVKPSFFHNKLVLAVNFMYRRVPSTYVISKSPPKEMYSEVGERLICSRHFYGNTSLEWNSFEGDKSYYFFDHLDNVGDVDYSVLGTDKIIVGKSTTVSAIHIAAYLGAKNIILCGVDGGTLDGQIVCRDYDITSNPHCWASYREFVKESSEQSREVVKKVSEFYGCNIYSLNPFSDFTFDGHVFEPA